MNYTCPECGAQADSHAVSVPTAGTFLVAGGVVRRFHERWARRYRGGPLEVMGEVAEDEED